LRQVTTKQTGGKKMRILNYSSSDFPDFAPSIVPEPHCTTPPMNFLESDLATQHASGKRTSIIAANNGEQKTNFLNLCHNLGAASLTHLNANFLDQCHNTTDLLVLFNPTTDVAAAVACLVPGGTLLYPTDVDVSMDLMIAGLVDVVALTTKEGVSLWRGSKPQWEEGAKASVKTEESRSNNATTSTTSTGASASATTSSWQAAVVAHVGGDDMMDLEDEDVLLELAGPVEQPPTQKEGGCATKKRACANCSCGRKEMEDAEDNGTPRPQLTDEELANMKSSCGNCHKGDAFRCAGCPFLGKPAYNKGEVPLSSSSTKEGGSVKLDSFVDADAVNVGAASTKGRGGVVVMDLGDDDLGF
jgi:hypothetical protein